MTDEQIAKLKQAHPDAELSLIKDDNSGAEVVVKTPSEPEWRRFRSMSSDENQRAMALRVLVIACVVQPPPDAFAEMLERKPGLAETFGSKLVEIAGVSLATTVTKL
jgi:hypothetical protein